jgi:hypothetical protein
LRGFAAVAVLVAVVLVFFGVSAILPSPPGGVKSSKVP